MSANTPRHAPGPTTAPRQNNRVGALWLLNVRADAPPPTIPLDIFPATAPIAGTRIPSFRLRRGLQDPQPPAAFASLVLPPGRYNVQAALEVDGGGISDARGAIDFQFRVILAPTITLEGAVRFANFNGGGVAPGTAALTAWRHVVLGEETRVALAVEIVGATRIAADGGPALPGGDMAGFLALTPNSFVMISRV